MSEEENKTKQTSLNEDLDTVEPIIIEMRDVEEESSTSDEPDHSETITQLVAQQKKLLEQLEAQKIKTETAEKQVLLDKLEQAGYNPELFKELDIKSLETTIKGLSDKDGDIIIPIREKPKEKPRPFPPTEMIDLKTGERYDFYERKMGIEEED